MNRGLYTHIPMMVGDVSRVVQKVLRFVEITQYGTNGRELARRIWKSLGVVRILSRESTI